MSKEITKQGIAQRQKGSPYSGLIFLTTRAPRKRLALIEKLMREEIFHGELDWIRPEKLAEGARKAYKIYLAGKGYFDHLEDLKVVEARLSALERRLEKANKSKDPLKASDLRVEVKQTREVIDYYHQLTPRVAEMYKIPESYSRHGH